MTCKNKIRVYLRPFAVKNFKKMKKEIGISVLLFVLCAVTSILNPKFLSPVNLVNTTNLINIYDVFNLGLGLVIITDGIDLSVDSLCALTGVILAMTLTE